MSTPGNKSRVAAISSSGLDQIEANVLSIVAAVGGVVVALAGFSQTKEQILVTATGVVLAAIVKIIEAK